MFVVTFVFSNHGYKHTLFAKYAIFFINPVNIIISCNYMDTIDYQCFMLVTYNPHNISKHNSTYAEFLVCDLPFSTSLIGGVGYLLFCHVEPG